MHMDKNSKLKFMEWAKRAEEDITVAQLVLAENGPPNQICFHAQQSAEKYLKGYLIFKEQKFEKVHQLRYLLELCARIEPSFEILKEDTLYLTRFYIETRYPSDNPDFTPSEAKRALGASLKIKEFILNKI